MQFVCFLDVFVVVESGFLQIDVLKKNRWLLRDHKVENSDTKFEYWTRSLDLTPVYKTFVFSSSLHLLPCRCTILPPVRGK